MAKAGKNSTENFQILHRSKTNRVVAGVAGGLGEYFDIDPTIIRIIFIVLTVFGGSGMFIYLVLWLIMPNADSDSNPRDHLKDSVDEMKESARSFASEIRSRNPEQKRVWLGVLILVFGIFFLLNNFGFYGINFDRLWPVILILLGFLILSRK